MKIENISRVCLTSRRTADQQGKCTVGNRMLAQIIINDENVFSLMHKILAHCTSGIRCNVLQRACLRSSSRNNNGVIHSAVSAKCFNHGRYGGTLLSNGNVDTDHILALLVDDGICCQSGLTSLTVTDDQLTLSSTNGNHGINCLDACLQRLVYALSLTDARSRALNCPVLACFYRSCTVNRLSKGIYNSPDHSLSNRNGYNLSGALYGLTFANTGIITK